MKTKKVVNTLMAGLLLVAFTSCKDTKTETVAVNTSEISTADTAKVLEATKNITKGYTIGDAATDFKLKDVDGKMVSMADYTHAKGFVVIFTCNTCPFAVASEDRIIALDKKYKALGYPVIAINPNDPNVQPDDTYELMQAKAKDKGFTFPYLYDQDDKVYQTYGATKTPHVYLLKKEKGDHIVKYIGAIDDNVRNASAVKKTYLANAINALLTGKVIDVKETKAIGCSIKV